MQFFGQLKVQKCQQNFLIKYFSISSVLYNQNYSKFRLHHQAMILKAKIQFVFFVVVAGAVWWFVLFFMAIDLGVVVFSYCKIVSFVKL